mmetsp:Transcript_103336/g.170035  ORF Transcript_103336/g.170035 Transcript_103336/m.170035 type:complete len:579 (+) Transcript_103336:109-1845(+)
MAEECFWARVEEAVASVCAAESAVQAMSKKVRRAFLKAAQGRVWDGKSWRESVDAFATAVYSVLSVSLDDFLYDLDLVEALDAAIRFFAPRPLFEGVLGTLPFEQAVVAAHDRAHQEVSFQIKVWALCDQLCYGPSAKKKVRHAAEKAFKDATVEAESKKSLREFIFTFIDQTIRRLAEETSGYPQLYLEEPLAKRFFHDLVAQKALPRELVEANQTAQEEGREDNPFDPDWWVDHAVKSAYRAHVEEPERRRKRRRLFKHEACANNELVPADVCSSGSEGEDRRDRLLAIRKTTSATASKTSQEFSEVTEADGSALPKARPPRGGGLQFVPKAAVAMASGTPTLPRPVSASPLLLPPPPPLPPSVSQSQLLELTSCKASAETPAKARPAFFSAQHTPEPPPPPVQPRMKPAGIVRRECSPLPKLACSRGMQASSGSASSRRYAKEELGEASSVSEGQGETVPELQAKIKMLEKQIAMQQAGKGGAKGELEGERQRDDAATGRWGGVGHGVVKHELAGEAQSSQDRSQFKRPREAWKNDVNRQTGVGSAWNQSSRVPAERRAVKSELPSDGDHHQYAP